MFDLNGITMSSVESMAPVMASAETFASCPLRPKCDFSAVDEFPLAMAYVPMQRFTKIYTPEKGLERGTLFEELDLPFKGERGAAK